MGSSHSESRVQDSGSKTTLILNDNHLKRYDIWKKGRSDAADSATDFHVNVCILFSCISTLYKCMQYKCFFFLSSESVKYVLYKFPFSVISNLAITSNLSFKTNMSTLINKEILHTKWTRTESKSLNGPSAVNIVNIVWPLLLSHRMIYVIMLINPNLSSSPINRSRISGSQSQSNHRRTTIRKKTKASHSCSDNLPED